MSDNHGIWDFCVLRGLQITPVVGESSRSYRVLVKKLDGGFAAVPTHYSALVVS